MQSILYCIALDAGKIGSQCRINAKRGEYASRKLRATITKDSCPFEPPEGAIISLRAKHESGAKYLYPCTADGGVIEYEFGSNILSSPGVVECEILIVEASGATLCSPCFELYVEDVVYSDDVLETVDEFTALTAALARVLNIEESEASRVTAELARVAAESLREAAEANRNTAEDERAAAELERETAEELRVSQENARDAAEDERVAAEQTRQAQEAARESGEDAREAAEDERVASELARVAAESLREAAEDARNTAENARAAAERTRQAQETTRKNSENDRNAAEAVRESAETARRSAEQARATAEDERATAEQTRRSQEVAREDNESTRTAAEAARANAETARVGAEKNRSTAEAGRISAEQIRQSQETARQTNTATAIQNANTATNRANTAAKACEDIAGGAFPAHASTHATGGSDAISPTSIGAAAASHTHGNLTSDGKIGSASGLPVFTDIGGKLATKTAAQALSALGALGTSTWIGESEADSSLNGYTQTGVYVFSDYIDPDTGVNLLTGCPVNTGDVLLLHVGSAESYADRYTSNVIIQTLVSASGIFFRTGVFDVSTSPGSWGFGAWKSLSLSTHTHTPASIGAAAASDAMLVTTYGGSADGVVKSADKLQTPRKIGNASFDGTKDISLSQIGAQPKTIDARTSNNAVTTVTAANNTEHELLNAVTSLTISFTGAADFDYWLKFTTGSSITVTLPETATYIGGVPTFEPNKTYEMSIKNGCVVCAEVVSA